MPGVRDYCAELSIACKDLVIVTKNTIETVIDNTNTAIQENILENKAVRNKLRSKQDENRGEISDLRRIISQLETSLQGLDIPHKVASTRLVTRAGRHQVELCRDQAHIALVKVRIITQTKMMVVCSQEIETIKESKILIEDKLREAENAMQVINNNLEYTHSDSKIIQGLLRSKVALEHEERARMVADQIDRGKCYNNRINIRS